MARMLLEYSLREWHSSWNYARSFDSRTVCFVGTPTAKAVVVFDEGAAGIIILGGEKRWLHGPSELWCRVVCEGGGRGQGLGVKIAPILIQFWVVVGRRVDVFLWG
jgi:hypothetical protein